MHLLLSFLSDTSGIQRGTNTVMAEIQGMRMLSHSRQIVLGRKAGFWDAVRRGHLHPWSLG